MRVEREGAHCWLFSSLDSVINFHERSNFDFRTDLTWNLLKLHYLVYFFIPLILVLKRLENLSVLACLPVADFFDPLPLV